MLKIPQRISIGAWLGGWVLTWEPWLTVALLGVLFQGIACHIPVATWEQQWPAILVGSCLGQGRGQPGHERTEHTMKPRSSVTDRRQHGAVVKGTDLGPDVPIPDFLVTV